jgi:hypothetical protein
LLDQVVNLTLADDVDLVIEGGIPLATRAVEVVTESLYLSRKSRSQLRERVLMEAHLADAKPVEAEDGRS